MRITTVSRGTQRHQKKIYREEYDTASGKSLSANTWVCPEHSIPAVFRSDGNVVFLPIQPGTSTAPQSVTLFSEFPHIRERVEPFVVDKDGWIMCSESGRVVTKLPHFVSEKVSLSVASTKLLAMKVRSHVIIMHFPASFEPNMGSQP
jgi:hypothetical protein